MSDNKKMEWEKPELKSLAYSDIHGDCTGGSLPVSGNCTPTGLIAVGGGGSCNPNGALAVECGEGARPLPIPG